MRFRISKTQHQYGMRWAVLESPPESVLTREICRCPSMADASLVCQSLNQAVKDDETWKKMLGKASAAFTKWEKQLGARTARGASSPARTARRGAGSAAQPADPRPAS